MNPFCALVCGKNSNNKRFYSPPSSREIGEVELFLLRGETRRGEWKRSLHVLAAGGERDDVRR